MVLNPKHKFTLEERLFIGHEQGLWRTYDYDHICLDMLGVPRLVEDCDPDDMRAYLKYRETYEKPKII